MQRLRWLPKRVVGDMAYISLASQRRIREELEVAVVTRLRPDMRWIEPYDSDGVPRCPQGQALEWLGYDAPIPRSMVWRSPKRRSLQLVLAANPLSPGVRLSGLCSRDPLGLVASSRSLGQTSTRKGPSVGRTRTVL